MGTAVLEAAATGVPHVIALAYDSSGRTPGAIHRMPYGNLGENEPELPLFPVVEELERLIRMTPDEYEKESKAVQAAAELYDENAVIELLFEDKRRNPKKGLGFHVLWAGLVVYDYLRAFCLNLRRLVLRRA
jgi:hypothetical protein